MLRAYDSPDPHVGLVHRDELEGLTKLVASLPLAQRKMLRGLEQERADIFPAGTIILSELLLAAKKDRAYVTSADLLLGYIARHAR
jgi:exopolyphosphatase/pppGpp-phosphohydrolase